jgi:hypothetical protein
MYVDMLSKNFPTLYPKEKLETMNRGRLVREE